MKDILEVVVSLISRILENPSVSLLFLMVGIGIGGCSMHFVNKQQSEAGRLALETSKQTGQNLDFSRKQLNECRSNYKIVHKNFDDLTTENNKINTKYEELKEKYDLYQKKEISINSNYEKKLKLMEEKEIRSKERIKELEAGLANERKFASRRIYVDPAVGPLITPKPVAITEGSSAVFLNNTLVIGLLAVGKDDTGYFANITISTLREQEISVRNGNHLKLSIRKQDYVVRVDEIMIRSSRRDNFSLPIEEGVVRISIMKL